MASLPFLISFTFSSANVAGSSARPRGSKYWPPG
uniref:Chlorophyll a-b binding protein 13ic n=1 Tax=Rhizophora mucronata TaxID=61149 RepID=A0A2P2L089_RHIMU